MKLVSLNFKRHKLVNQILHKLNLKYKYPFNLDRNIVKDDRI